MPSLQTPAGVRRPPRRTRGGRAGRITFEGLIEVGRHVSLDVGVSLDKARESNASHAPHPHGDAHREGSPVVDLGCRMGCEPRGRGCEKREVCVRESDGIVRRRRGTRMVGACRRARGGWWGEDGVGGSSACELCLLWAGHVVHECVLLGGYSNGCCSLYLKGAPHSYNMLAVHHELDAFAIIPHRGLGERGVREGGAGRCVHVRLGRGW